MSKKQPRRRGRFTCAATTWHSPRTCGLSSWPLASSALRSALWHPSFLPPRRRFASQARPRRPSPPGLTGTRRAAPWACSRQSCRGPRARPAGGAAGGLGGGHLCCRRSGTRCASRRGGRHTAPSSPARDPARGVVWLARKISTTGERLCTGLVSRCLRRK